MGFGDLKNDSGLKTLNDFLQDRSYIEGYQPSQADSVVFSALSGAPKEEFFHILRWFNHISSYGNEKSSFPGSKKCVADYGPIGAAPAAAAAEDDDDDDDLFGSEDDEDDEELEAMNEARRAKLAQVAIDKKAAKPTVIAKSSIVLSVKGWDDETDFVHVEKEIRNIEHEGLRWASAKLEPVAYGVKKLLINCIVVDDECGTDFLEETILEKLEDYVQSVDIESFNKV